MSAMHGHSMRLFFETATKLRTHMMSHFRITPKIGVVVIVIGGGVYTVSCSIGQVGILILPMKCPRESELVAPRQLY
jgi:hypothetical protein